MRWGTDLIGTWTTPDGSVIVLLTIDQHTTEILGIHAAKRATRWETLAPVRQAVRRCFGGIDAQIAAGVELRDDNGSQYISEGFQDEIAVLGLRSSLAFIRTPTATVASNVPSEPSKSGCCR